MDNYDALISCASWEDRFILGNEKTISSFDIDNIHILAVEEFLDRTEKNRLMAKSFIDKRSFNNYLEVPIKNDLKAWRLIEEYTTKHGLMNKKVLVDISTMPRCLIWFIFHFLTKNKNRVDYIYYSPGSYGKEEWLVSDPEVPKLVLKHSGIAYPDQQTVILVQTGYELERVSQLISQFEPVKILLAVQSGEQLENLERNLNMKKEYLRCPEEMIQCFYIDAFSEDHGYFEIKKHLDLYREENNIIMCSLGPKSGAIALFKLNMDFPEYGLVYTAANEYNSTYSSGINVSNIQFGSLDHDKVNV